MTKQEENQLSDNEKVIIISKWVKELAEEKAEGYSVLNGMIDKEKSTVKTLTEENIKLKEQLDILQNTFEKVSSEHLNKLVNDKIIDIMNNPLEYVLELPILQRNEFVGRIIKSVLG